MQNWPPLPGSRIDIPFIGPWKKRIGRVESIYMTPCDAPVVELYVLAVWTTAPYMLWSLFGWDCTDMAWDGLTGGHRKRRFRWRGAHVLRGAPRVDGRFFARFLIAGDLLQRFGWYMALASVTADGLLDWISLPMMWSGCNVSGSPHAIGSAPTSLIKLSTSGSWSPFGWIDWQDQVFSASDANVVIPKNHHWQSYHSIQTTRFPPGNGPDSFNVRVVDLSTGDVIAGSDGDPTGPGEFTNQGWAQYGHITSPATIAQLQYQSTGDPAQVMGSHWSVTGQYVPPLIPSGCYNDPQFRSNAWWEAQVNKPLGA